MVFSRKSEKDNFFEDSQGKRVQDIWDFKDPQYPEYPTEKSAELFNHYHFF